MANPPKDDDKLERDVPDVVAVERPSRTMPPPIPKAASRGTRTVHPPPIPRATKPALVHPLVDRLETPTALERALRQRASVDIAARARELVTRIDALATSEPGHAAVLAYELGELAEKHFKDPARAIEAYRRAHALDSSLRSSSWALRRALYARRALADVARVIESELEHVPSGDRTELVIERASVSDDDARTLVEEALAAAPLHQGALLQLERLLAAGDTARLPDVWQGLAKAVEHPLRKIGFLLELATAVSKADPTRARRAFEVADTLAAGGPMAKPVARQRLLHAEAFGSGADVDAAIERYAAVLTPLADQSPHHRRELVAVLRRRARRARLEQPADAWGTYEQALAVSPGDPLVLVDLIESAAEAGHGQELPHLVQMWARAQDVAARQDTLVAWWARSFDDRRWRELVIATAAAAPGWIAMLAVAECDAVAHPNDDRPCRTLAEAYVATARAARAGTWMGAGHEAVDLDAAAALFAQGAEVFAHHLPSGDDLAAAREALAEMPTHPIVIETAIELEDVVGDPRLAVDRLREVARSSGDVAPLLRALRIARSRSRLDVVLELERDLLEREPFAVDLAWQHETTLMQLGYDDERAELFSRIARHDPEPGRRYTALLGAARLHARLGETDAALDRLRQLRDLAPSYPYARQALVEMLRRQQRWPELVELRREELTEDAGSRAALHEIAWVLEVCLADPRAAAEAYAQWVKQLPADRAALEGLARCRAAIGDGEGEASARGALLALDDTLEARWLYARSLERANASEVAIAEYRKVLAVEDAAIPSAAAALALVGMAARRDDRDLRAEVTAELARRCTDARLAASLFEEVAWQLAVTGDDATGAASAFASALDASPDARGPLVGALLVATAEDAGADVVRHAIQLAQTVEPDLAIPLLLRASAYSLVDGDGETAHAQIAAAQAADPDHPYVQLVALETGLAQPLGTDDPFLAAEHLAETANTIALRGALVDDQGVRDAWELDRADVLEHVGQLTEAARIIRGVLERSPGDRRALVAFRRIAERVGDPVTAAHAARELASRTVDPAWRLALLREAAEVFQAGAAPAMRDTLAAIYLDILALEPSAPEIQSLHALLRERGDAAGELAVIDHQLAQLAAAKPPEADRIIELLLERARLLRSSDPQRALADLDAVQAFAPHHLRAAKLRGEIAGETGKLGDEVITAVGTPRVGASEGETGEFYAELTDPEGIAFESTALEDPTSRYRPVAADAKPSDSKDLFDESTLRADLRELEEQEKELARQRERLEATTPRLPTMSVLQLMELARRTGRQLDRSAMLATAPRFDPHALSPATERELAADISEVVVLPADELQPLGSAPRDADDLLAAYEREAASTTDPATLVALHTEAGRLAELLGDDARARASYEAAVRYDPRAARALRGLRRAAYRESDVVEVVRVLDAELAVAGKRERLALQRYRLDFLLALGELDGAKAVIRELLEHDPGDSGAQLARAQIAFVERAHDDMRAALDAIGLAPNIGFADHAADDESTATEEVAPEPEDSIAVLGLRWAALWRAYARGELAPAAETALELAFHVEADDPTTTAALAVLAQTLGAGTPTALEAAQLTIRIAARDALAGQIASETALAANDTAIASRALGQWARSKASAASRAYAAARAAELDPQQLGRMWSTVVELDPDDEYAVAKLRTSYQSAGKLDEAVALELRIAQRADRPRIAAIVDAAESLIEETRVTEALELLTNARTRWPGSVAVSEALADALAGAGLWAERARLFDELASAANGTMDAPDLMRLRAAASWELAAQQIVDSGRGDRDTIVRTALQACARILDADDPRSPFAHGTSIKLAHLVPDRRVLSDVLARVAANEPSPLAVSSLALRRARTLVADASAAREIARSALVEDPRRSIVLGFLGGPRDAATAASRALDERARARANTVEHDSLVVRAAQLATDGGDPVRALALCARVGAARRLLVADVIEALGAGAPRVLTGGTTFTRVLRDAELAIEHGEADNAVALARRALELAPDDPAAALVHDIAGMKFGHPVRAALARIELATARGDRVGELAGYEQLADAAALRGERSSVISALRNVLRLDGSRIDLVHRLERELLASGERAAVRTMRRDVIERTASWPAPDRAAFLVDTILLAVRGDIDDEVVSWCRAVLDIDPRNALAMFHAERAMRASATPELAALYQRIADAIGEPRSRASFACRCGDIFARLDRHRDAARAFAVAVATYPMYEPALESWRASVLDGALWPELADIAVARERAGADAATTAADHHLAGVALMDMQRAYEPAIAALQRVLAHEPTHADALLRLRILLDITNRHGELVSVLEARLEAARDRTERIELERELAELHFTSDRDRALQHYRRIIAADPTDIRAHAAIADLAGGADADAVAARLAIETDPRTLSRLHARLGALLAGRDDARALVELQRAAELRPDDPAPLAELAAVGARVGAWKVAGDACETLLALEKDPDRIAAHLELGAAICIRGFGDRERAERMLTRALESSPTSSSALQALIDLHADGSDLGRLRSALHAVVTAMRQRIEERPADPAAYRMLAIANTARVRSGEPAHVAARASGELAHLLTTNDGALPIEPQYGGLAHVRDHNLLPPSFPPELHALFRLMASAIADVHKVALGTFGVSRKQRLKANDPITGLARAIGRELGITDVDVYVSEQPLLMAAEPLHPCALILGEAIAADTVATTYAAGAALKLAQMSLAVPARLSAPALATLVAAMLRAAGRADAGLDVGASLTEVEALEARLRRALGAHAGDIQVVAKQLRATRFPRLARDLKVIALRAGFVASGSLAPGLRMLAGGARSDLRAVLTDPVARELVDFALAEDAAPLPPS